MPEQPAAAPATMISVDQAMAEVRGRVGPVGAETVPVGEALGRILAADLAARLSHPPADVSAMDGYAVRAADCASVPVRLAVIGESAAGRPYTGAIGPGQCTRIFTGAALPAGADAIVIQEDTVPDGDTVTVRQAAVAGEWIRTAGMDFAEGRVLLTAGRLLSVRDVALAAAMNHAEVQVRRRPRVCILSSGDELVEPGAPVPPGHIVRCTSQWSTLAPSTRSHATGARALARSPAASMAARTRPCVSRGR